MRAIACLAGAVCLTLATAHAQEPHAVMVSHDVALSLVGSYALDRPASAGVTEIAFMLVDQRPRLQIGPTDHRLVAEGVDVETSNGERLDSYKFTVVGKPGVSVKFKMAGTRVAYLVYAEDFAQPPLIITGKPKR